MQVAAVDFPRYVKPCRIVLTPPERLLRRLLVAILFFVLFFCQVVWGSRLGGVGSQGILAAAVDPGTGDVFAAGFTGDESGGWVWFAKSQTKMLYVLYV